MSDIMVERDLSLVIMMENMSVESRIIYKLPFGKIGTGVVRNGMKEGIHISSSEAQPQLVLYTPYLQDLKHGVEVLKYSSKIVRKISYNMGAPIVSEYESNVDGLQGIYLHQSKKHVIRRDEQSYTVVTREVFYQTLFG